MHTEVQLYTNIDTYMVGTVIYRHTGYSNLNLHGCKYSNTVILIIEIHGVITV
jgi:hypothetical protein